MKTTSIGCICALIATSSCSYFEPAPPVSPPPEGGWPAPLVPPTSVDAERGVPTVTGRVFGPRGELARGAQVWACGVRTTTDYDGWFRLSDPALSGCVSVQARLPSQVTTSRPLDFNAVDHATASLHLPPLTEPRLISGSSADVYNGSEVKIRFPGGGFALDDGTPWILDVVIRVSHIGGVASMVSAPGGLATSEGPLESSGMIGVELETIDGRALSFSGEAEIEIPSHPLRDASDPSALYHWSDGDRHWRRAGEAELIDGVWHATVNSFSWWNIDKPADTRGCVSGQLATPVDFLDLSGAQVIGRSSNGVINVTAPDMTGAFCLDLPEGPATVSATLVVDDVAWTWEGSVDVASDGGECGARACAAKLGRLEPRGEQLACIKGIALEDGCLLIETSVPIDGTYPELDLWRTYRRAVERGPFTRLVPWSHRIRMNGQIRESPNLGQGAIHLGVGAGLACADFGSVETIPTGERDSGIMDSGSTDIYRCD